MQKLALAKLTVIQLRSLVLHVACYFIHVNQILSDFGQCLDNVVQLIERDRIGCFIELCEDRVGCLIQCVKQVLLQLAVVVHEKVTNVIRGGLQIGARVLDCIARR